MEEEIPPSSSPRHTHVPQDFVHDPRYTDAIKGNMVIVNNFKDLVWDQDVKDDSTKPNERSEPSNS